MTQPSAVDGRGDDIIYVLSLARSLTESWRRDRTQRLEQTMARYCLQKKDFQTFFAADTVQIATRSRVSRTDPDFHSSAIMRLLSNGLTGN